MYLKIKALSFERFQTFTKHRQMQVPS
uniref:Uncharacterized protein n=1 Tax=Arundo donax TaxID=35708 RepID=A0A0A9BEX7_ARUDO